MLFFHTFTGCNVVSEFCGKETKSTWLRAPLLSLRETQNPLVVDDGDMEDLQRFVVMMYNLSSTVESVYDVRLDMLAQKQRHTSHSINR